MGLLSLLQVLVLVASTQANLYDIVVGVASWLESSARCRNTSQRLACTWAMNSTDDAPAQHPYLSTSLYYGSPGIAIFLSQLADAAHTDEKLHWSNLSQAALEDVREGATESISSYGSNVGFYYGLAGIAWSLRTVGGQLSDSNAFLCAAGEIEAHILNNVAPFSNQTSAQLWNNTDIAHGAAGTGLSLLWTADREVNALKASALRSGAKGAGEWLLKNAENAPGGNGLRWWRGPDTDGSHVGSYYPTFCCGTAGVGYFLAQLSLTMDETDPLHGSLLQAAIQAGQHVLSLAVEPVKGTLLLPHGEQSPDTSTYFLGWCGGPPGWARLFVKLWEATHEMLWLDSLAKAVKGIESFVLPKLTMMLPVGKHGPWQNLGQCCGAAAAGSFLLQFATSDLPLPAAMKSAALAAARQVAQAISAHAVQVTGGIALPSAEEHAAPNDTRWQSGWMQGAAGVASFLLHMHVVETGGTAGSRQPWPDEPWQPYFLKTSSNMFV